MTLSTIDNPYSVIGANTIDADKVGGKVQASAAIAVSSHSFCKPPASSRSLAGSDEEFDLTLEMKDETVAHEAKMGEDHQKYDGLGLFSADAAAIESTRAAKKPMKPHRTR